jgi:two-component system sensor histidine kinase QseC
MPTDDATAETAPLIRALNALLERVAAARERERNFTAFAAHELRTPLAGIKTQAQIAIESGDPRIREKALHQIVHGVTRTGRLVRQLLDMASVEATGEKEPTGRCVPGRLLALLRDELTPHGGAAPVIVISEDLFRMEIDMNAELFTLAARNLIENAILHAGNTMILCKCLTDGDSVEIAIDDDGPGIPAEDLVRVTERFFRSGNKAMIGSGLGLSIAEFAVARGRAKLLLRNRKPIGLSARMIFDRRYVSFENSLTKTA